MNSTAHKVRSSVAAAGVGLLLATAGVSLAPSAAADTPGKAYVSLNTATPHEVGFAGQPVEFTDTVTGSAGTDASADLGLFFSIDGGMGLMANAVSLEYRADDGSWQRVPLNYHADKGLFDGMVPPGFHVAAGRTRTFHLRLGLPMGTPHHGSTNGGTQALKVITTVAYRSGGAGLVAHDDTVAVDAPTASLTGVPKAVTAGGAPVTFKATLRNPTPSSYVNLDHVLFTTKYATVQVLRGGHWTTLTPRTPADSPDRYGFTLDGKDSSLAAHATTTATVRLSYRKGTPAGTTALDTCLIVNEGSNSLWGTTMCAPLVNLTVKAATTGSTGGTTTGTSGGTTGGSTGGTAGSAGAAPTPTPTGTATAAGTTSGGASGTSGGTAGSPAGTGDASAQLAHTGSGSATPLLAGAGALLLAGLGTLTAVARRRRTAARRTA